jgi:hypothetical protein
MDATVERLPDYPALLTKYSGIVTLEIVRQGVAEAAKLMPAVAADYPGQPIFQVMDTRQATSNFTEIFGILRGNVVDEREAAASAYDVRPVFLGTDGMARLYIDSLAQFGGRRVPLFKDLNDALEYIRAELANVRKPE